MGAAGDMAIDAAINELATQATALGANGIVNLNINGVVAQGNAVVLQ